MVDEPIDHGGVTVQRHEVLDWLGPVEGYADRAQRMDHSERPALCSRGRAVLRVRSLGYRTRWNTSAMSPWASSNTVSWPPTSWYASVPPVTGKGESSRLNKEPAILILPFP